MSDNLDKILARIRKLLDLAEHANTPPHEAELARAKAEHLMREYRVEEEQAIASDPQTLAPVAKSIDVTDSEEFGGEYASLLAGAAEHAGCRVSSVWSWGPAEQKYVVKATLVGYDSDSRLAELLFTNARLAFSEHLEPRVDPALSDQVNAYRLRRAGLERHRVATLLWGWKADDGKAHGKVSRLYKTECEERGENPALAGRGVNAKLYRKEYAQGFVSQFYMRLRRARDAADRIGGLPALHGRQERVDEVFFDLFPNRRPAPASQVVPGGKPAKVRKVTKADEARYQRRFRPEAVAARAAGKGAADTVAINGDAPGRIDRYTAGEREETRAARAELGPS